MKKGLTFRIQKREKAGKLKSEEETREGFREFSFIFCLRHYRVVIGEWSFSLCKIGRESTERVSSALGVCFHIGRERLEYRWAAVAFLSSLYVYVPLCTRIA